MITTRDRVKRAIDATARQIAPDSLPPLYLPPAWAGRRPRTAARRRPVWLAPAAAAAAVAAIATAAVVISNGVASRSRPTGPTGAAAVSVPPYYIALTKPHGEAAIFATRTGALLARVVLPANLGPVLGLTAAADDRTFAVTVAHQQNPYPAPRQFLLVKFNPLTRKVLVTPVPGLRTPGNVQFAAFALSPSGTRLAIGYMPNAGPKYAAVLKVADVATGASRTWTDPRGEFLNSGANPLDLSWASDNRTLAFNWYGFSLTPGGKFPASGLWLLDTAKAGGNLIASSRLALAIRPGTPSFAVKGGYLANTLVLTPDGKTIIAAITSKPLADSGFVWFATYNAATGKVQRIFDRTLVTRTSRRPDLTVLWTSPSGTQLVVHGPPGFNGRLGIVRQSGRLTLLPAGRDQLQPPPGPAW